MSFPSLQEVANNVTNTAYWVADNMTSTFDKAIEEVSKNGTACIEFVERQYTTVIEPQLQFVITKLQNLDFTAILSDIKTFAQSDFGISAMLFGTCVSCVIIARQVENKVASVFLVIAGIASATCSAVMLFKPEYLRIPASAIV